MSAKKIKDPNFSHVKTIALDFGNVVLDIDISLSINEFKRLGLDAFTPADIHPDNSGIFYDIEIGALQPQGFVDALKGDSNVSDSDVISAWNKLLLPYDYKRFELIQELRKNYRVVLLSNTNKIHHDFFEEVFDKENPLGLTFKSAFDHVFYSDELGCRKPGEEIYQKVAQIIGATPDELLFVDDNAPNLIAPSKMGWSIYHLQKPETIFDLFETQD